MKVDEVVVYVEHNILHRYVSCKLPRRVNGSLRNLISKSVPAAEQKNRYKLAAFSLTITTSICQECQLLLSAKFARSTVRYSLVI
jgi:hypothetical protein